MVTVRELLVLQPGLVVRAGAGALDREVRWAHVSELPDPTPYLRGGELVLSAGVHLPRRSADFRGYARRLAEFGVAGLGFGIDPIHAATPPALVSACEQIGLVLLEVPPSIPFIAISEALASEVEARHLADLRRLNQAQRALVNAAARPRATATVVRRLAEQLRAGVLLVEPERRLRWTAGAPGPDEAGLATQIDRVTSGRAETGVAVHDAELHVIVAPVHGEERRAALVVARATALSAPERGIVSVGGSVLSMLWRGLPRQTGLLLGAALTGAAAGLPSAEWEPLVARALGVGPGDRWRAIACAPRRAARSEAARERWRESVRTAFASPLLIADRDEALVLVPDAADPTAVARGLADRDELVGVSGPQPWTGIALGAAEARRALAAARITGRSAAGDGPEPHPLDTVVDAGRARAFAGSLLAPVYAARSSTAPELLATLRTWLEHHGSWDRTAAALGLHRNTVRNRIALLARLLERDLDDAEMRWQLLFALRWLQP